MLIHIIFFEKNTHKFTFLTLKIQLRFFILLIFYIKLYSKFWLFDIENVVVVTHYVESECLVIQGKSVFKHINN